MFKTAIVGCGGIARTHATYLSKMENVEIVAVCDILNERAEYLKNTYAPNAQIFDDYVKMLDTVKPDVLHVCTPHYLHSEMAIAALKRDIHVLLEKPVSITMAQVNELIEAEKESNAKICISFQNRYLNRNKTAKQLIDSGKAGKVLFANGTVLWHRDAPYYIDSHWRGFMATEGGGVMINQAIHTLDLMLWMCGDPEKLTAMTANYHLKDVIDVEDTASTYITFKNGAKGMFYATTAHYTDAPISLEIVCENMKLELKNDDLYIDGVKQELYDDALDSDGKGYWGVGHMMLFNDFYSKLTTNEAMPIGVFEASKALKVLLAMYESNGKEITF